MSTPSPDATLRGRWLHIARLVWVVVALLYVGVFVFGIPSEFARLNTPCTGPVSCNLMPHLTAQKAQELKGLNLSLNLFAAYFVAVEIVFAAVSVAVGALIFWRPERQSLYPCSRWIFLPFGRYRQGWLGSSALHRLPSSPTFFPTVASCPAGHAGLRWRR